ncbi:MAG TPA: hypothetical protein VMD78_17790 [Candidatus Baltobacteraceae bacterium]|nr:hypothetical protein [Candidatus Baltobacteraceae bacterium]
MKEAKSGGRGSSANRSEPDENRWRDLLIMVGIGILIVAGIVIAAIWEAR